MLVLLASIRHCWILVKTHLIRDSSDCCYTFSSHVYLALSRRPRRQYTYPALISLFTWTLFSWWAYLVHS